LLVISSRPRSSSSPYHPVKFAAKGLNIGLAIGGGRFYKEVREVPFLITGAGFGREDCLLKLMGARDYD
jgi:hypothetical protein